MYGWKHLGWDESDDSGWRRWTKSDSSSGTLLCYSIVEVPFSHTFYYDLHQPHCSERSACAQRCGQDEPINHDARCIVISLAKRPSVHNNLNLLTTMLMTESAKKVVRYFFPKNSCKNLFWSHRILKERACVVPMSGITRGLPNISISKTGKPLLLPLNHRQWLRVGI